MKAQLLTELTPELQAARDDEMLAEGGLREAVGANQWTAAHEAVDQLCAARERRAELEHEIENLTIDAAASA